VPRHRDRGGHPVVLRAAVLAPYRGGAPPPPLREVLRALGSACARVEVGDPDVIVDLDTPSEIAARFGAAPRFL
jgi:CTP:molybdopterin cytidylyltransferase MocA